MSSGYTTGPTARVLAALLAAARFSAAALVNARSATQHLLATRGEHSLERFDTVIGRLEEKILHYRFGTLQLRDQHLRVRSTRHLATDFGHDTVAARAVQDDEDAPLPRLHEVRGLRDLMLCYPWSRSPRTSASSFPSRHSFGRLPERRSKEYTLSRVSRRAVGDLWSVICALYSSQAPSYRAQTTDHRSQSTDQTIDHRACHRSRLSSPSCDGRSRRMLSSSSRRR